MIIDKKQLISLLVEKTGLGREQVENQLSELVNRIQKAADEGKSFEIEGFGTFRMEDDNLHFEPGSTLETEINNKYAGMKPIELIGAFKQPDSEEIPDMIDSNEDEGIWAFDEESAKEKTQKSDKEEKESEEEPVRTTEDQEPDSRGESVKAESPKETEEQTEEVPASAEDEAFNKSEEDIDLEELGQEFLTKEDEGTNAVKSSQRKRKRVASKATAEGDPIGRFLMVAVILIVVGVAGWFIYDYGFTSPKNTKYNSQTFSDQPTKEHVPTQQAGDRKSESQTQINPQNDSAAGKSEPEQKLQVTKQEGSQTESNAEQKADSTYGLRGAINHSISSGYTIVVHSLKDQTVAENKRQQLQEEGFRALIQSARVNGVLHYRVGIGQLPTIDAALQAIEKLPEPYKSNNFIKRIKQQ